GREPLGRCRVVKIFQIPINPVHAEIIVRRAGECPGKVADAGLSPCRAIVHELSPEVDSEYPQVRERGHREATRIAPDLDLPPGGTVVHEARLIVQAVGSQPSERATWKHASIA